MGKIENHKFTIQEAFQQNFYTVPDYQREYVWTDREVAKLLDDFDEQLDATDREYFIGMVLVSASGPSRFDVIDGQQRLTTLFLLLCALRRRLAPLEGYSSLFSQILSSTYSDPSGKIVTSAKLDPRYPNAAAVTGRLANSVFDPQSLRSELRGAHVPMAGSVDFLVKAYDQIVRYLDDNYRTDDEIKRYWGFLANRVVFIQIETDVSSALKIFETINERGVGLSPMDLLKNLLFTNVKPEQFPQLKVAWKKVTEPFEVGKEKPLRFLRYFLMASYPVTNKAVGASGLQTASPDIIREDEIYDWLTDRHNAAVVGYEGDPFGFVSTLSNAVETYLGFIEGKGSDGQASPAVKRLYQLTGGAFSLHYILLLAAAPLPKSLFDKFVGELESFLFSFIFTKAPSRELERNFSAWSDELRAIAQAPREEQEEALASFISERLAAEAEGKRRELVDALRRYSTRSMPNYRTKYLLGRMTQYVDMAFAGTAFKGTKELGPYLDLEIEHILPQNPEDELRDDWKSSNPDAEYDDYAQRLGNLTMLEKPHNIVAGRDMFEKKLSLYEKSGSYLTRSIAHLTQVGDSTTVTAINEFLDEYVTWTAENVEKRQERLAELALAIWKVKG